jgi:hypothetical protein
VREFFYYAVLFFVLLVGGYVLVRAWSKAHYRSKMEHFRAVMHETHNSEGDRNDG